jgi:xanthine/uracil/vitamin C permease (AzgA family)
LEWLQDSHWAHTYVAGHHTRHPSLISEKFTYSVVGFHGTGIVTYREALAAVFMEGRVTFLFISEKGVKPS